MSRPAQSASGAVRPRTARQWSTLAILVMLFVSIAAFFVVFTVNARSLTTIRAEAEKVVLIIDMTGAVQTEASEAGRFVADMDEASGDEALDHDAMTGAEDSMPDSSQPEASPEPAGSVPALTEEHHKELASAIANFGQAEDKLRGMISGDQERLLADVVDAHGAFVASFARLDSLAHDGESPMALYHGETQLLEGELRASLRALERDAAEQLQGAIADVRSAEVLLLVALPLILITGGFAGYTLVKTTAARRRVDMLESLVEAKDEFLGAVSHELRTPLTGIVGFADLLRESQSGLSDEERSEIIHAIADQGHEVAAIVEDLLVSARAEIGELSVASVPVDLRAQVSQVIETLQPELAGVEMSGAAPVRVLGDPGRVRQILRNLLTNAQRYGTGETRVVYGSTKSEGSLQVHSSGDPIPESDHERIFEPYQRAHDRPGLAGSIGLGLAVSRQLARLMGGDLTYSTRDGMNVFELTLPLFDPADDSAEAALELSAGRPA